MLIFHKYFAFPWEICVDYLHFYHTMKLTVHLNVKSKKKSVPVCFKKVGIDWAAVFVEAAQF